MASIKEVLEYLLGKDILVKEKKTGRIVLGEYGYIHLEKEDPDKKAQGLRGLAESVRQLFPAGVKSGGMYVRSSVRAIEYKLGQFKKKFPEYTDEQIIGATRSYIEEYKRDRYMYMKTAEYFILKDSTSLLETWINNIEEGEVEAEEAPREDVV